MRRDTNLRMAAFAILMSVPAAGCGSGYVRVTGQVTDGGRPFTPTADETVVVTFAAPDVPAATSATVQPDGTFVVYGPDGDGVLPGRYTIGLASDVEDPKARKRVAELTPDKSAMVLDVSDGRRADITVDIARRELTR